MKNNITIVIVHWNTPNHLKKLLNLLSTSIEFQIIVIDNASTKPITWLKNEFPTVTLIENKFNRGFAFACNQGVTKAVGEWLLFLNPDVEITSKQIYDFISYAKKNNFDACSIKTSESYQKPLPSWLSLLVEFSPLNRVFNLINFMNFVTVRTLFGGCLLIKKAVIMSLGGFDERFFLWFEDSDLTLRLLKNNFRIGWFKIPIKHSGGESFKKLEGQIKRDIFFHSMDIYAKKHFNLFDQLVVRLIKKRYSKRKLLPEVFAGTSIVIPNLKYDLLQTFFRVNNKCLDELDELIVVTSSLNNQNIWEWRKNYPKVRFIPIEKNKGFASTVNIGFRVSSGKWVGTINDDVILTKGWLTNLLTCCDNSTGSINPVIKKLDGRIESAGIKILPRGKAQPITKYHIMTDRSTRVIQKCNKVDATNAACVIYSKEALNNVSLFDDKFGSYLEDIDISLRLRRAGYKNKVCLNSAITHLGQSSSKDLNWRKQYFDSKNWILVILKNWSFKDFVVNFPSIFIERLRNISGILKSCFN